MDQKQTLSIPHDIEAEQAILGTILENNGVLVDGIRILKPESFYNPAHQHAYRALFKLDALKNPIDEIIIGDQLRSLNQLNEAGRSIIDRIELAIEKAFDNICKPIKGGNMNERTVDKSEDKCLFFEGTEIEVHKGELTG